MLLTVILGQQAGDGSREAHQDMDKGHAARPGEAWRAACSLRLKVLRDVQHGAEDKTELSPPQPASPVARPAWFSSSPRAAGSYCHWKNPLCFLGTLAVRSGHWLPRLVLWGCSCHHSPHLPLWHMHFLAFLPTTPKTISHWPESPWPHPRVKGVWGSLGKLGGRASF